MTPASWASARRLRRAHWHERATPFAYLAGEGGVIRVALYVRNRVEGVAQLVLTNLVHRPDDSMLPLGDVTSEAWGHETATGENRRALAQAGRWVSSALDTALAGEEAWVVAVDLQDPRDYQMPGIDERKSHRDQGARENRQTTVRPSANPTVLAAISLPR